MYREQVPVQGKEEARGARIRTKGTAGTVRQRDRRPVSRQPQLGPFEHIETRILTVLSREKHWGHPRSKRSSMCAL